MPSIDNEELVSRRSAVDLRSVKWEDVGAHPLSSSALRTLRYMQDIESHTIVYLRTLLTTRAMDDPEVATFLACWFQEETVHGMALGRFLAAAGYPVEPRPRSRLSLPQWAEARATALVARAWGDFVGVHMAWGAINELTTLVGYQRLSALAGHPVLSDLLANIIRDESRHFSFYYEQARRWLSRPRVAPVARALVERFWAPVGSGVQPDTEVEFLAGYLFSGTDGRRAACRIDERIRELPGFAGAPLVEAWMVARGC